MVSRYNHQHSSVPPLRREWETYRGARCTLAPPQHLHDCGLLVLQVVSEAVDERAQVMRLYHQHLIQHKRVIMHKEVTQGTQSGAMQGGGGSAAGTCHTSQSVCATTENGDSTVGLTCGVGAGAGAPSMMESTSGSAVSEARVPAPGWSPVVAEELVGAVAGPEPPLPLLLAPAPALANASVSAAMDDTASAQCR